MSDPSQSKINQFKRLFGFGAKPSVKQPTPPLAQELKQTDIPVQSPVTDTTPPVADATVPGLIDKALANLGTTPPPPTNNLAPEPTQPVIENLAQPEPEQTPVSTLVTKITDAIEEFREVTKEKVAA